MIDAEYINTNTKIMIICVTVTSIMLGSFVAGTSVQNTYQLDAAQTECAEFDPKTGQFHFLPTKLEIPHIK